MKYVQIASLPVALLGFLFSTSCTDNTTVTAQFEKGIQQAIARARSSVVTVEVVGGDSSRAPNEVTRRGAGVIIGKEGLIATASEFLLHGQRFNVLFQDGCAAKSELVGCDTETNIALLKTPTHVCGCFPISVEGVANTSTGRLAILVNNSTVSKGVTANMGVMAESWLGGDDSWSSPLFIIQTGDIFTMPGAPVISLDGSLIGICDVMIESHSGSWTVIPTETIFKVTRELEQNGTVRRGWIGIACSEEDAEQILPSQVKPHIRINQVVDGSPAQTAGLTVGDYVTAFNQKPVENIDRLRTGITGLRAGSTFALEIVRQPGISETVEVITTTLPTDADRPRLCGSRTL